MPAIRPIVGVCLALALALALAPAALAAAPASPDTARATLPDLTVIATPFVWSGGLVPSAWLAEHADGNLGQALEGLPGLAMVRRAADGTEPVIRGLGYERVRTLMGAVPLHGACPGRMDPPVTYLSPLSAPSFSVTREAGVEAGAGGIAGAITANPDYERRPGSPTGWRPFLEAGWESARDGWRADAGVEGGTERLDLRATAGRRRLESYTAPDGRLIPAGLKETSANLSAGWRPAAGQRLWGAANYVKEQDVVYTALPMDNRDTDVWIGNAGWRQERHGAVRELEVTGGFSSLDHLMDNRDKPNYGTMHAETNGQTDTWAGRARASLDAAGLDLRLGADVTQVKQDALRSRTMTATDVTYWDHMWPDAVQTTYGGLAEARWRMTPDLRVDLSGRLDGYDSKARAADDASLGGMSVRQQYVRWYGAEATTTDRTETAGQAALRLTGGRGTGLGWHVRSGIAARPAGIGERYLAFAPAPGGYLVGNPTLKAEKAWQSEVGATLARETLTVAVTAFHDRVTDYILPTVIARQDVNGDNLADVIKGFVNRDARLVGGELDAEFRPQGRVRIPVALAWVLGRNTTDHRDLPEIPAFGGRAEVRWLAVRQGDWWLRAGAKFAADQPKIDPLFGEDRTPGWAVWHVGVEARPLAQLTLRVLVDNLFDRLWWDHLTREAVLPLGGLAAGDEVPMPGRSVTASARWTF